MSRERKGRDIKGAHGREERGECQRNWEKEKERGRKERRRKGWKEREEDVYLALITEKSSRKECHRGRGWFLHHHPTGNEKPIDHSSLKQW